MSTPTPAPTTPLLFVIFGATGDLAARKLFPALYRLFATGMLPGTFRIIGTGRHSPGSDDDFRGRLRDAVREHSEGGLDGAAWERFAEHIGFVSSSAEDGTALAETAGRLRAELGDHVRTLLYLSVPPGAAEPMIGMLGETGLAEGAAMILEKPFGWDLSSSRSLDAAVERIVPEERVFRIDHFLGKEAVQNLLVMRFANGLLEPVWNRDHIAYVQIDVPEEIGIEGRSSFMESTGTFRDMVPTHLCQILGFVALEPPVRIAAPELRAEKLKVYRSMRQLAPDDVVLGQYEGYREEEGVADDSEVETFAALRVWIDNWRWQGVPFFLRTGKRLAATRRTVTVGFTKPPLSLFGNAAGRTVRPDEAAFELTDAPCVTLRLRAKEPGPQLSVGHAALRLTLDDGPPGTPLEAYEKLLLDAINGDQTLFTDAPEIERIWATVDPFLADRPRPLPYAPGSWGPAPALELPGKRGWAVQDE